MKWLVKSIPKSDFIESMVIHEATVFPDQLKTLSRWFKRHLANAWDLELLTDEEALAVIKSLRRNKNTASAIVLELRPARKNS